MAKANIKFGGKSTIKGYTDTGTGGGSPQSPKTDPQNPLVSAVWYAQNNAPSQNKPAGSFPGFNQNIFGTPAGQSTLQQNPFVNAANFAQQNNQINPAMWGMDQQPFLDGSYGNNNAIDLTNPASWSGYSIPQNEVRQGAANFARNMGTDQNYNAARAEMNQLSNYGYIGPHRSMVASLEQDPQGGYNGYLPSFYGYGGGGGGGSYVPAATKGSNWFGDLLNWRIGR